MCSCGHSGDGKNSEHSDYLPGAEGHGQCLKCNCRKFTWAGWIVEPKEPKPSEENFKELPRRVIRRINLRQLDKSSARNPGTQSGIRAVYKSERFLIASFTK